MKTHLKAGRWFGLLCYLAGSQNNAAVRQCSNPLGDFDLETSGGEKVYSNITVHSFQHPFTSANVKIK